MLVWNSIHSTTSHASQHKDLINIYIDIFIRQIFYLKKKQFKKNKNLELKSIRCVVKVFSRTNDPNIE